jgi:hypothetical protein
MENSAQPHLLPGVSEAATPPEVVCDSRRIIASARRRAVFRDFFNLLLLASVDTLFLRWPHAHVPLLDRHESVVLLAAANAASLTLMWSARLLPRWRARRVAETWCSAEQKRSVRL